MDANPLASATLRADLFRGVRRIVIKVGTSILTRAGTRMVTSRFSELARQVALCRAQRIEVILVSSGAVGAGSVVLGRTGRPRSLSQLQATASVGQPILMQRYRAAFGRRGLLVGQVLLTWDDLTHRRRFVNARRTILTLLADGVVPIVNENDAVAVEEIQVGDNDRLSALVADLVEAQVLVMLSDVDGLYGAGHRRLAVVSAVTPEVERWARGTTQAVTRGGMVTKLAAVKLLARSGAVVVIANGRRRNVVTRVLRGDPIGTVFLPRVQERVAARKRWLAVITRPRGRIIVDDGARAAVVERGKSLLASGILRIEGEFRAGDPVGLVGEGSGEFARGLTNYGAADLGLMKGRRTADWATTLGGGRHRDEVVHRNNLVVL